MDPNIPVGAAEYVCVCGKKIRVDFESMSTCMPQGYQHDCGKDEEHYFPGPIIATWEERDGRWFIVNLKKRNATGSR